MHQLKNIQHDFEVDVGQVGVTVRLGTKWSTQTEPGEMIQLWQCNNPHDGACPVGSSALRVDWECKPRGTACVIGYWVGCLMDLPDDLLALEHEIASRTWEGLLLSLRRAYGATVDLHSTVTALVYVRVAK